ncbi:MAG: T9SS type A sorting domain-containing protein [Flavobacteriales bacterium]|nr:T9SS type A sorting domain-containing protein [Flavobacteriales bacterium]
MRILLSAILLGTASLAAAQQHVVGEARLMEPIRALHSHRAIDTLFSSILETAQPALYGVQNNGGYVFGTNSSHMKAMAQQFLLFGPVGVKEALFWFGAKADNSGQATSVVKANIYAMNNANGTTSSGANNPAPGTVLASVDLSMAQIDTSLSLVFTVAQFPSTVSVGTEFAAGFDLSALASTDTVALVSTSMGEVEYGDFSWTKLSNNQWRTTPAVWSSESNPIDADLYIFVVVDDEDMGVGEESYMNNSRLSFVNGNISNGSVLLAYDVVKAGRMDLVVHNSLGQAVSETAFGNQTPGTYNYTLSTEGWAPGNYYVTIKNNGRPLTKKLFVR